MTFGRPDETPDERADRNLADLLQELRVAQTGIQILFAFLLTMPLQARFERLDGWERGTLILAILLCALAMTFLIAPVAMHRVLFARHVKPELVRIGSRLALAGLTCLGLAVVAAVELVLDLVIGRPAALTVAGALAALLLALWGVAPVRLRERVTSERPTDRTDHAPERD